MTPIAPPQRHVFCDDPRLSGGAVSHQYRSQIVKLVTAEARQVATDLGGDYRIVLEGIDRPVEWFRLGVLELGLFVPYRYTVIPQSVTTLTVTEE